MMNDLEVPDVSRAAFVAANATVVGRVSLARDSSVWFNAVIRGDNDLISIGEETNVQDGVIIHTDEGIPLVIGARVTIGHAAMIHGATIDDECLIGIGAILLNRSRIGKHSVVGAGALVTEGKTFAERSLILGSPARAIRTLSDEDIADIRNAATHDVEKARRFTRTIW